MYDKKPVTIESRASRTVPQWTIIIAVIAGIVLIGAAIAFGVNASNHLTTEQATLAVRDTELSVAESDLVNAKDGLAAATIEHEDRSAEQDELTRTVRAQTACIRAQQVDVATLQGIIARQTDNFNKTAEDSGYAKADIARGTAIGKAIDAYYAAALARSEGRTSAARSSLSTARAQERKANEQRVIQKRVLVDVDRTAAAIATELEAFEVQLAATAKACGLGG